MTYEEKTKKFLSKGAMEAFREKTPREELPFKIDYGSSSHHPERKGGVTTCDIRMWCKFLDGDWFTPYGHFGQTEIEAMIDACVNDNNIVSLMELLAAKDSKETDKKLVSEFIDFYNTKRPDKKINWAYLKDFFDK